MRGMQVKTLLSPLWLIPTIATIQFLTWFFAFQSLKYKVPGLESVPFYFSFNSIIKYIAFFSIFYIFIFLGYHTANFRKISSNTLIRVYYLEVLLSDIFLILILVTESLFLYKLKDFIVHPYILLDKGFQVLAYETLQNKENWYRTFYNFLPLISDVYIIGLLTSNSKSKYNKYKRRLILVAIISIFLFFRAARQVTLVVMLSMLVLYIKYKGLLRKKIKFFHIFSVVLLIMGAIILSELLRFGVFNAKMKSIPIFSFQNAIDVVDYMIVAYIAKNVNNSMIYLDSPPTLGMMSHGSRGVYTLIERILNPPKPKFKAYIGPHGTLDIFGILWIDWGWGAPVILAFLGLLIGYSYRMYVSNYSSTTWNILFALVFPGVISIFRINYFFLNIFLYPFLGLIVFSLIRESLLRVSPL